MCAIFGTINFHINQNDVREALSKMNHRGPDNNGAFFDQTSNTSVIFGHNRLEILDIKTGIKPFKKSKIKTRAPYFFPKARRVFVAPAFPLPILLMSTFFILQTRILVDIDPNK